MFWFQKTTTPKENQCVGTNKATKPEENHCIGTNKQENPQKAIVEQKTTQNLRKTMVWEQNNYET